MDFFINEVLTNFIEIVGPFVGLNRKPAFCLLGPFDIMRDGRFPQNEVVDLFHQVIDEVGQSWRDRLVLPDSI